MKIMVTGGSSMIGSSIVNAYRSQGHEVDSVPHDDCDLLDYKQVYRRVVDFGPNVVIHAAGWNGGISWNKQYPATIYQRTAQMAINLYTAIAESKYKIDKVVGILASCSYPDLGDAELYPEVLGGGMPNPTVECHGLAKRIICDYGRQIHKQYGIPCVAAVLTNSFGPGDSYHPDKTKVVGALIRRIVEAKDEIVCWGSGSPKRQLIYSEDVGPIVKKIAENYDNCFLPINIGSPHEVTIKDLTYMIADILHYEGSIRWDITKPDGQMRKYINIDSMLRVCGDVNFTPLKDALTKTIDWYLDNKDTADAKISR